MLYDRSTRTTSSRAPVPPACVAPWRRTNGRANAMTTIASARQRITSNRMCRNFWRRTERYGIRWRNINDGNCTTSRRSRLIRWMITGTERAANPAKKRGARNDKSINDLCGEDQVMNCATDRGATDDEATDGPRFRSFAPLISCVLRIGVNLVL